METNKREQETKRKREEGRESLEATNPFSKSKKTGRSPARRKGMSEDEEEMGEVKILLRKIAGDIEEIKADSKRRGEEMKEMKKEMKEMREEMRELKEEWKEKEGGWKKEKEEWERKWYEMERRVEQKERRERKNNIVISGVKWEDMDTEKKIEAWMKTELAVEVKVEEAYKTGDKRMIVVKLKKWEEKKSIMVNKSKLKGIRNGAVYINDDWTKKEREVQKRIREEARIKVGEGQRARVGYMKIEVNGIWYKWDEKKNGIDWNENFQ